MRSVIPTQSSRAPSGLQTAALLGVAGLAAALWYVQSKQRTVERDYPPQGKFIDVDGVRLHYIEKGQGPALVLLHGNALTSSDFSLSGLLDSAAQPYRVIAFDRPGFGYSNRPDNLKWTPEEQAKLFYKALHQMGVEHPIVLGHSWGTLVALAMALDFPKYVRAIALVSGYYYPSPRLEAVLLSPPGLPAIGRLLRHTVAPLLARVLWAHLAKRTFSPAPVPERFLELPKWMMLRPVHVSASAAEMAMMVPSAARLAPRYRELTLPIAIIAGRGDKLVSTDHHALRLHEEIQHSELVVDAGAGHMPHYADPAGLMEVIARLEASLTPGGNNLRHAQSMHSSVTLH